MHKVWHYASTIKTVHTGVMAGKHAKPVPQNKREYQ